MAPRRILSAFTIASDGVETVLDLPKTIIELVRLGADGYFDARINKFQALKATRDTRQYQGIVYMNRWYQEPPLTWNPDLVIFAATVYPTSDGCIRVAGHHLAGLRKWGSSSLDLGLCSGSANTRRRKAV
jgi:hypothetical protein